MLGLASTLTKGGASLLTFVKDNLKLYLDFNSKKSDTLKFPSEGSTSFDGNDHISIADSSTLTIADGQGFTASIWFKTSTATEMYLFDNRSGSEGFTAIINAGGTNYLGHIHDGSNALQFTNTENYNDGAWHHFAFTFDGTDTITSYIDGNSVGTGTQALGEVNGGNLLIGKPTASDTKYWNGSLANFAIWSRELTPEEIQSIMNKSYSQLKGVEKTPSLVSWWALDNTELGTNLVSNGDFSNGATGWTDIGTGWDLTGGNATSDNSQSGSSKIRQSVSLVQNKVYRVSYDWSYSSVGSVYFYLGSQSSGWHGITGNNLTADILYTGSTGAVNFDIYTGADSDGTIDNISLQEFYTPDSKGSNNGTVTGATTTTSVYGGNAPILPRAVDVAKEGQADAIGNGSLTTSSGGYADLGNDSLIQFGGSFSVSCWFKTTDTTATNEMVIAKADDGSSAGWLIRLNSSRKLDFNYVNSASGGVGVTISDTGSAVNDGEWYHVAFVHESGVGNRAYKNGILIGSNSTGTDLGSHTPNLHVGNQDFSTPRALDGSFAQVGLWQGALTQSQVQELLESTSYSKIPADVKSKTTEKLPSPDLTSGTGLTITQGTTGTLTHDTNAGTITATDDVQDAYLRWYSAGLEENKLYKLEIVVDSYTGGRFRKTLGWNGTNFYPTVGTNIQYFIGSSTSSFGIQFDDGNPAEFVISKISVQEVTNDLVAYYPLDGDSEVKGLSFDGNDDKIENTSPIGLPSGDTFTISAWIKVNASHNYASHHFPIFRRDEATNNLIFIISNTTPKIALIRYGAETKKGNTTISDDTWHHIVVSVNNLEATFYLNGSADGTQTFSGSFSHANELSIGQYASDFADGSMSSIAVYNVNKSASEVLSIYNDGIGGDESSNSGLVGYWKMDNDTTVVDNSSNSNNGTVTGATLISAGTTDSVGNNDGGLY